MKKDKFVLPLELKTGKQTNSIEHRSQVSRLFSVLCFHKRKFPFQLVRFCQFLISILVCQLLYDSLKIYGDYSNFILIVEYCTLFIVLYSKVCFHPLCVTSFSQLWPHCSLSSVLLLYVSYYCQVMLYSLMMKDLDSQTPPLGLLLYLKTGALLSVMSSHMDQRGNFMCSGRYHHI